jgi:hypothetical protein
MEGIQPPGKDPNVTFRKHRGAQEVGKTDIVRKG